MSENTGQLLIGGTVFGLAAVLVVVVCGVLLFARERRVTLAGFTCCGGLVAGAVVLIVVAGIVSAVSPG